jgi:exonuclease SbcC
MRNLSEERDRLRGERQSLSDSVTEAKAALIEARAGRERAEADQQRAEGELARGRAVLAVPLALVADWPQRLATDAPALAAHCQALAEEWRTQGHRLDVARESVRTLASKVESARAARANADQSLSNAQRVLTDEQTGLERLRDARAALFEGRDTASVRARFETTRTTRQAEHHAARDAWAAADRACGIAEERRRLVIDTLASTGQAHQAAVAAQESHLAEIGLDIRAVFAALERGEAWAAAEETRQASLRDQETIAAAVLAERRVAQETHHATRPARDEAEAAALLPGVDAALDAARESLGHIRARLAEDDRNRDAAIQTRERLAAQRRRFDLWKGMADLIGSADGRKFRQFAQGLTLDRLLHLANGHLTGLTTRYALQRAPGGDLDLQVIDRDMADEVRGVASLSGGERFLVSLSLALGLASMTGSRTLAESLFIDEGFGALDAESLDVAISALETLHASGRTVGVISHVQPMIERIGVQIRVTKHGFGRSSLEVRANA